MNTIDTRIVEMQFENGKFERDVEQTIGTLQKLDQSLDFSDANKSFASITTAAQSVDLSSIDKNLDWLKKRFSVAGEFFTNKVTSIMNTIESKITSTAKSLTIQPIYEGWEEYNLKTKSTQTILNNVKKQGNDINDVNEMLDKLNAYADKTTYNFANMVQTAGGAAKSGLNTDELLQYSIGLSNLAAFSGADNSDLARAGYQINQALTKGYFALEDWRSIVNANLDSATFIDELQNVAREGGVDIDAIIEKYGSFQQSLTETKWLTSEIFLETVGRFADEDNELGKLAMDAATKTKTWGEVMDQVHESIGSGWSRTWEILFGDVEEAKQFWSPIAQAITAITDTMSNSRNSLLEGFEKLGGRKMILSSITSLLKNLKTYLDIISDAWSEVIPEMTARKLQSIMTEVEKFFKWVLEPSKERLETVKNITKGIATVVKILLTWLKSLFKITKSLTQNVLIPIIGVLFKILGALGNLIYKGGDMTKWGGSAETLLNTLLKMISKFPAWLDKTVAGVIDFFSVVKPEALASPFIKGYDAIKQFCSFIQNKFSEGTFLGDIAGGFKNIGSGISNIVSSAKDFLKLDNFTTVVNSVSDGLSNLWGMIVGTNETEKMNTATTGVSAYGAPENIVEENVSDGTKLSKLKSIVKDFMNDDDVKSFTDKDGTVSNAGVVWSDIPQKIVDHFQKAWEELQPIAHAIRITFQPLVDIFSNCILVINNTLKNLADGGGLTLEGILNSAMIINLIILTKQISKFVDILKNLISGPLTELASAIKDFRRMFNDPMQELASLFKSYTKKNDAIMFKSVAYGIAAIAISVLALVGAIVALTFVDTDKLATAAIVVGAMTTLVGTFFVICMKLSDKADTTTMAALAFAIAALGTTLLELSIAIMLIQNIPIETLTVIMIGFIGIMAMMVVMFERISNVNFNNRTATMQVVSAMRGIVSSILLMSAAMWIIGQIDTSKLGSVTGVLVLMLAYMAGMITVMYELTKKQNESAKMSNTAEIILSLGIMTIMIASAIDIVIVGIAALMVVVNMLGDGWQEKLWNVTGVVATMALLIGVFFAAMTEFSKNMDASKVDILIAMGGILVIVAFAIDLLIGGMIAMMVVAAKLPEGTLTDALLVVSILSGILLIFGTLIGIASYFEIPAAIMLALAGSLFIIAASLMVLTLAFAKIAAVAKDMKINDIDLSAFLWNMLGPLALLMLITTIAGLMSAGIGGLGFILIATGFVIFASALEKLMPIIQKFASMDTDSITKGMISIAVLALIMVVTAGLLSLMSPALVVLGIAAIEIAISIWILAAAIGSIAAALVGFAAAATVSIPTLYALSVAFSSGLIDGLTTGLINLLNRTPEIISAIFVFCDAVWEGLIQYVVNNISAPVRDCIRIIIAFGKAVGPLIASLITVLFDITIQILQGLNDGLEKNKHKLAYYIGNISYLLLIITIEALWVFFKRLASWTENAMKGIKKKFYNWCMDWAVDTMTTIVTAIANAEKGINNTLEHFGLGWISSKSNDDIDKALEERINNMRALADKWHDAADRVFGDDDADTTSSGSGLSKYLTTASANLHNYMDSLDTATDSATDANKEYSGFMNTIMGMFGQNGSLSDLGSADWSKAILGDKKNGTDIETNLDFVNKYTDGLNLEDLTKKLGLGDIETDSTSATDSINDYTKSLVESMDTQDTMADRDWSSLIGDVDMSSILGDDAMNPTVTPVLDLSEITAGAEDMSSILNSNSLINASSTASAFNYNKTANQEAQASRDAQLEEIMKSMNSQDQSLMAALAQGQNNEDIRIYLDNDVLVGELYRGMDSKLGKAAATNRRQ